MNGGNTSIGASDIGREAALRRMHEDRWQVKSFHATCDGPADASLSRAAELDPPGPGSTGRNNAWKTYLQDRQGPYVSVNGRWRTRRIEAGDELALSRGWSHRRPWVLEEYDG